MKPVYSAILALLLTSTLFGAESVYSQEMTPTVPAFPGAEGYGALSQGGRGGRVIQVVTLKDSGPGSLRAAIEAEGPRTVVFRVAGTIELKSPLDIENPYITIAGQTAPAGGIAIRNHPSNREPSVFVDADHVIIRYLRIRPGPSQDPSSNVDALAIKGGSHIIVDHCSFSWSTDETVSIWYDASDITIQWSIISEGLSQSTYADGEHSRGMLIGDRTTRTSVHHNLFAHNNRRNPRINGGRVDLVNNIIFNTVGTPIRLFADIEEENPLGYYNVVGNYILAGPDSEWDYEIKLRSENGSLNAFLKNNIGEKNLTNFAVDRDLVDPDGREFLSLRPHLGPSITTTSPQMALEEVLDRAGANIPRRDGVDSRVITEVRARNGIIIDDPSQVGGWPSLKEGKPLYIDSDQDGMPDDWESARGLDHCDSRDGPLDRNGDGYTNLEEFLNGEALSIDLPQNTPPVFLPWRLFIPTVLRPAPGLHCTNS